MLSPCCRRSFPPSSQSNYRHEMLHHPVNMPIVPLPLSGRINTIGNKSVGKPTVHRRRERFATMSMPPAAEHADRHQHRHQIGNDADRHIESSFAPSTNSGIDLHTAQSGIERDGGQQKGMERAETELTIRTNAVWSAAASDSGRLNQDGNADRRKNHRKKPQIRGDDEHSPPLQRLQRRGFLSPGLFF